MDINKLMPLLVLAAIGWHSKGAIQSRMSKVSEVQQRLVTEHDMNVIMRQAKMAALDNSDFSITNLREFIRGHVQRGLDNADPSIDAWGRPYRHELRQGRLTIKSAGPDTRWGTDDDLETTDNLTSF